MTPSWLDLPPDTPFPVDDLPYGVFSVGEEEPRVGVAIGGSVLDLAPLAAEESLGAEVFEEPTLNPFMALGRPACVGRADHEQLVALPQGRPPLRDEPFAVPDDQRHVRPGREPQLEDLDPVQPGPLADRHLDDVRAHRLQRCRLDVEVALLHRLRQAQPTSHPRQGRRLDDREDDDEDEDQIEDPLGTAGAEPACSPDFRHRSRQGFLPKEAIAAAQGARDRAAGQERPGPDGWPWRAGRGPG
jgi:hypothetical protein